MNDSQEHQTLSKKALDPETLKNGAVSRYSMDDGTGEIVNASGHKDQLRRQYGLLSICGLALTIDNAWVALGGSITVSICKLDSQTRRKDHLTLHRQTMVGHQGFFTNS